MTYAASCHNTHALVHGAVGRDRYYRARHDGVNQSCLGRSSLKDNLPSAIALTDDAHEFSGRDRLVNGLIGSDRPDVVSLTLQNRANCARDFHSRPRFEE